MKRLGKQISVVLTVLLILISLSGLNAFAEENSISIYGANGNATHVEKGTSMKITASGVTQGKSVRWSVTGIDGSSTDLATVESIGPVTAILTASISQYGSFKVVATQNDSSGKKGEQTITITGENLVTVDDTDSSIIYVSSGSGETWEQKNDGGYYQGTGKSVTPPEDDSYSSNNPAYAEFTFTGTGIQWIGESNYYCGVAEVYLDDVKVSTVDPFIAPKVISQFVNFSREGLPYGQHTIKVVVTGLKNPASTVYPGTRVLIDAFRYLSDDPHQQVDKTALAAKIAEAQGLTASSYTQASWEVLQNSVNEAIAVYNRTNATQAEVDTALAGLQSAITGLELMGPAAILSANDYVQPGESFVVGVNLNNLEKAVHAEDITLAYDSNLFEYMDTTPASSSIMIADVDSTQDGVVRILAANEGGITGNTHILNIGFKAKSMSQNTTGVIEVTQAKLGIAPEGTVIQAALTSKSITIGTAPVVDKSELEAAIDNARSIYANSETGSEPGQYPVSAKNALLSAINTAQAVLDNNSASQAAVDSATAALKNAVSIFKASVINIPGVDKSELASAISSARTLHDSAIVGDKAGQYPAAAKTALNSAINTAQAVMDDGIADQAKVDSAVTALNSAVDTFKASKLMFDLGDINGDGTIDIGDLAMAAYYYGKDSTATDWATARIADMNSDNKIDISDLAFVASKIPE